MTVGACYDVVSHFSETFFPSGMITWRERLEPAVSELLWRVPVQPVPSGHLVQELEQQPSGHPRPRYQMQEPESRWWAAS